MIGYRFHPTDTEIIDHYLRNKILGNEAAIEAPISEFDVYRFEPWDLQSVVKKQSNDSVFYLFSRPEKKYLKSQRSNRCTRAGFWKATGKDRAIQAGGVTIGFKKTLVFHTRGDSPYLKALRTGWIMHEYRSALELPNQVNFVFCKVKCTDSESSGISFRNGGKTTAPVASQFKDHESVEAKKANHQIQETTEYHANYAVSDIFQLSEGLMLDGIQNQNGSNTNQNIYQQIQRAPESLPVYGRFDGFSAVERFLELQDLDEPCNDKNVNDHAQEPLESSVFDEFRVPHGPLLSEVPVSYDLTSSQNMHLGLQHSADSLLVTEPREPSGFSNCQSMVQPTYCSSRTDFGFLGGPQDGDQEFFNSVFADTDVNHFTTDLQTHSYVFTRSKPLTGVYIESETDTDTESIDARSSHTVSSPTDSNSKPTEKNYAENSERESKVVNDPEEKIILNLEPYKGTANGNKRKDFWFSSELDRKPHPPWVYFLVALAGISLLCLAASMVLHLYQAIYTRDLYPIRSLRWVNHVLWHFVH